MPELPEVETIRRDLEKILCGAAVTEVTVQDRRLMSEGDENLWRTRVLGSAWEHFDRHGKFLSIRLASSWRLVFHLRMTGQLLLGDAPNPDARMVLAFANGRFLSFVDQRRFGECWLRAPSDGWHNRHKPGPDALTELTETAFV